MPMKPVLDEFVSAGDLRFHYVQWGEHGVPIVCISGITANAFCFQAFADDLWEPSLRSISRHTTQTSSASLSWWMQEQIFHGSRWTSGPRGSQYLWAGWRCPFLHLRNICSA